MSPSQVQPSGSRLLLRPAQMNFAICAALVLSIFSVYARVSHYDFIASDDDAYVVRNSHVQGGLTPANLRWVLTGVEVSNWMPVTLASHLVDVQLFDLASGMHHLTNVVIHALASLLLFLTLQRATRATGPSAFVAFIFALHPLHVESVAWISERKDVLSAFFFFLTLYGYVWYAERPSRGRYLAVLGAFCLGLMSKPMLVTLPFVLLLLDIWPLRRFAWPRALWEKLPLLVLSAADSVITYRVQLDTGAFILAVPLQTRLAKAATSYITYIRQTFWPSGLAVFYPYPRFFVAGHVMLAVALVAGISALVIYSWRTRPYYAVGWFWYLGTLVPAIGLVQVGFQSHADRYMYIPMVGLLVMLAWGGAEVAGKWPRLQPALAGAAILSVGLSMALTWRQTAYWENCETLYMHAIAVTDGNYMAHNNLGYYLREIPERQAEAVDHFETAVNIKPDFAEAQSNLGASLVFAGFYAAAVPHLEAAVRAMPRLVGASNNLGLCLLEMGRDGEAASHFEAVVRISPDDSDGHFNLARALARIPGRAPDAMAQYEAALRLNPGRADAHRGLAELLMSMGRPAEAMTHYEAAQRIRSDPQVAKILDGLRTQHDSGAVR